ncbi:uncharacterized protein GGS22DRAFT_114592 [Annulohypoxylon maeteangense]|uniref:uncharacterized protein n=1 Tax=Annulohypoxylon maeteangense TaxID=1927788 RepID=UPI0020084937|nr:uncharacterized protein GGS22DRAFT_114592 [Annulohypoxylon maeteangense]KAI0886522.1 hypothetical protein GGS22DRAFT_114592 [Annulohypoxylon maeteangense]
MSSERTMHRMIWLFMRGSRGIGASGRGKAFRCLSRIRVRGAANVNQHPMNIRLPASFPRERNHLKTAAPSIQSGCKQSQFYTRSDTCAQLTSRDAERGREFGSHGSAQHDPVADCGDLAAASRRHISVASHRHKRPKPALSNLCLLFHRELGNLGTITGICGWLRSLQLICATAVGNRGFANQRSNKAELSVLSRKLPTPTRKAPYAPRSR